jgi:hypothetical protein
MEKDPKNPDDKKYKLRRNTTNLSPKKEKSPSWSQSDINLAKCVIEFVNNRIEIIIGQIECIEKVKEQKQCIEMALDMAKRKTYR